MKNMMNLHGRCYRAGYIFSMQSVSGTVKCFHLLIRLAYMGVHMLPTYDARDNLHNDARDKGGNIVRISHVP